MLSAKNFFNLGNNRFSALFEETEFVWEALQKIRPFLKENLSGNVATARNRGIMIEKTVVLYDGQILESGFTIESAGKKLQVFCDKQVLKGASVIYAGAYIMDDNVYIGKNSVIEPGALIKGPALIGDGVEVRHGAYIRGDVLIGDGSVVGHTTEIKSSIMVGGSKAGHFAYIGDSILGSVNLGAGTKLANLKMIDSPITVQADGKKYNTGLRKFGAILGDGVETGCNSVTTPGSLLSRNVLLYPNSTARGYYPPDTIIRAKKPRTAVLKRG